MTKREIYQMNSEKNNSIQCIIRSLLLCCLFSYFPSSAVAQEFKMIRGGCMPDLEAANDSSTLQSRKMMRRGLPSIFTKWDSTKTYKQLVILVEYAQDSVSFSYENPLETYQKIFNEAGYNERNGKGCAVDYFREQSGGLCNLQFDVYGPYKVNQKAQPYDNPSSSSRNYSKSPMMEATNMFLQENPNIDFSQYDWDNDGKVNQVVFVHAGFSGNISDSRVLGYHWPNTGSFTTITTPDGKTISNYTSSAELWPNKATCGIATICHEFTHSLGLPDIYPVPSWTYTAVDEWDLMDGGTFTNYGWCPPNYSPLEKMLLGWAQPIELTEAATIEKLKPVSEGGEFYQIKHTDTEYLLLENRQWSGWDAGVPGKGLVVYHVNYIESKWKSNGVNGTKNVPFNYAVVHADNRDYDAWTAVCTEKGWKTYQNSGRKNSRMLSGSPYPYATDSTTTVMELTDTSIPNTEMINENSEGSKLLAKPITNIKVTDDGLISFDFMGGVPTAIRQVSAQPQKTACFDLSGRQYQGFKKSGLYIERRADGTVRKVLK